MDRPTAIGAVQHELSKFPFEVGLHLQHLEAQHLRLDGDLMRAVATGESSRVPDGIAADWLEDHTLVISGAS
jgi:hypothetical protein